MSEGMMERTRTMVKVEGGLLERSCAYLAFTRNFASHHQPGATLPK
jgi:hypothetical protein